MFLSLLFTFLLVSESKTLLWVHGPIIPDDSHLIFLCRRETTKFSTLDQISSLFLFMCPTVEGPKRTAIWRHYYSLKDLWLIHVMTCDTLLVLSFQLLLQYNTHGIEQMNRFYLLHGTIVSFHASNYPIVSCFHHWQLSESPFIATRVRTKQFDKKLERNALGAWALGIDCQCSSRPYIRRLTPRCAA